MENIPVKRFVAQSFQTTESIKTLRTNLLFSGEDIHVVALTSAQASEGKSTLAFQLSASFAESGKRVLLLDADLRNSTYIRRLRIRKPTSGLCHCLTGMVPLRDCLMETDIPGFYLLLAGAQVPNAAELLGGNNFKRLIATLRESFDIVIVDTAPLGLVIDSAVVAPEMDGVVLVIDSTNNSYKSEQRVIAQLRKTGCKLLGVVLNRVDDPTERKDYGKAYGYGKQLDV